MKRSEAHALTEQLRLDADEVQRRWPEFAAKVAEYRAGPKAASTEPGSRAGGTPSSPTERQALAVDPAERALFEAGKALRIAAEQLDHVRRLVDNWTKPAQRAGAAQGTAGCSLCGGYPAHETRAGGNLAQPVALCPTCRRFVVAHGRIPTAAELARRAAGGQLRGG